MMDARVYDDGEGFFVGGGVRVLAGGSSSPLAFLESVVPAGFPGPKPHRHAQMFDIFYILEGELLFQIGDEQRRVTRSGFVMVPPGVVHTFSNPGSTPTRFLNIYHPAGLEEYVVEVAKRMAEGHAPSGAEMAELAKGQDFEVVRDMQ